MQNKIEKLPKWAREYIEDLQRDKDEAVRVAEEFIEKQLPSNFFMDNHKCCGKRRMYKNYFYGNNMTYENDQISINISPTENNTVNIYFNSKGLKDIYLKPRSSNLLEIVPIDRQINLMS